MSRKAQCKNCGERVTWAIFPDAGMRPATLITPEQAVEVFARWFTSAGGPPLYWLEEKDSTKRSQGGHPPIAHLLCEPLVQPAVQADLPLAVQHCDVCENDDSLEMYVRKEGWACDAQWRAA